MEIVIASTNLHKIRELREFLKGFKLLDVLSLSQFPEVHLLEESGVTFQENANAKAIFAAKALNRLVLADDSGLVVPNLEGHPGILSKRYAGSDATDSENRQKLLKEMEGLSGDLRSAYYECCLALANPEGLIKSVQLLVKGLSYLKNEDGAALAMILPFF